MDITSIDCCSFPPDPKRESFSLYISPCTMLGMSDLVNGVSVLLAFYVGYRYGLKISREKEESVEESKDEKTATRVSFPFPLS